MNTHEIVKLFAEHRIDDHTPEFLTALVTTTHGDRLDELEEIDILCAAQNALEDYRIGAIDKAEVAAAQRLVRRAVASAFPQPVRNDCIPFELRVLATFSEAEADGRINLPAEFAAAIAILSGELDETSRTGFGKALEKGMDLFDAGRISDQKALAMVQHIENLCIELGQKLSEAAQWN